MKKIIYFLILFCVSGCMSTGYYYLSREQKVLYVVEQKTKKHTVKLFTFEIRISNDSLQLLNPVVCKMSLDGKTHDTLMIIDKSSLKKGKKAILNFEYTNGNKQHAKTTLRIPLSSGLDTMKVGHRVEF